MSLGYDLSSTAGSSIGAPIVYRDNTGTGYTQQYNAPTAAYRNIATGAVTNQSPSPVLGQANTSSASGLNSIASAVSSAAGGALSAINPIAAGIQAGTGLVSMLDDIFDWSGKRKQQQAQFNKQIEMQEKQWEREDNAVQRRAEDLEKAGLSKTLAAGSAAQASSPIPVSVPNPVEGISGGVQNALKSFGDSLQGYMVRKEMENKDKADRMALKSMSNSLKLQKNEIEMSDIEVDNARFAQSHRTWDYIRNNITSLLGSGVSAYSGISKARNMNRLTPYIVDNYRVRNADVVSRNRNRRYIDYLSDFW